MGNSIGDKIKRAYNFLTYELWRHSNADLQGRKRLGFRIMKTLVIVVRGFINKDLNMRASALTYSLLFAMVPILAMIIAIAKGFGFAGIIESYLNNTMMGETNMVPTIMSFVERYLETAQGGLFLGIGLLILLWAVYSFFRSIETTFNDIWNVNQSRSILRQLTVYITILFAVPILLILSSGIHIMLDSVTDDIPWLHSLTHSSGGILMPAIQWVSTIFIFTWIYWAIPNTKVQLLNALIPAVVVGTLFQILETLSVYVIVFLSRTSIVYGAFASIPILLTWMQWMCLLILIGAEISFASQNNELFEFEHDLMNMSRRYKDFVTLFLLSRIAKQFDEGKPAFSANELSQEYHLPLRMVQQLLDRLKAIGMLCEVYHDEEREQRSYQPAISINKMKVGMVLDKLDMQGEENFLKSTNTEMQAFWKHFLQLRHDKEKLDTILIHEI